MKEELLLGIDIGTSVIKSVVFSTKGRIIGSCAKEIKVLYPEPGWAEQDPNEIWKSTCEVISNTLQKKSIRPNDIIAISITGHMQGSFLLDKNGQLAREKAIIWLDTRSKKIFERCSKQGIIDILYNISGLRLTPSAQVMHLSWLRENEPWTLRKAKYLLACKDYIRYKLTNVICTDITDASATGIFDIRKKRWSDEICELMRLPKDILPDVRNPWEYAGEITKEASSETGLKKGIPVAVGAGDVYSTALGAGVVETGQFFGIIGTAGIYGTVTNKPIFDDKKRFSVACHAVPNRWLLDAAQMTAGEALRWFKDELCLKECQEAKEKRISPYQVIDDEVSKVPPGANSLIFHPFLQGERSPFIKPNARGLIFGLRLQTKREDILRAIFEGVAFAARDNIELFKQKGLQVKEFRIMGGGANSDVWCQIFADILNCRVSVPEIKECGALGSAIQAGVVAGIFSYPVEGARRFSKVKKTFYPINENVNKYDKIFALYKKLYKVLWTIYDEAESVFHS